MCSHVPRTNKRVAVVSLILFVLACAASCSQNKNNSDASTGTRIGTHTQSQAAASASPYVSAESAPHVARDEGSIAASSASHTDAAQQTGGDAMPSDATQDSDARANVLFDFRRDKPLPRPSLAGASLERVYRAVYGEQYARVEPLLKSAANGSFTRAGGRQTAYVLQRNAGESEESEAITGAQLAIFEADRLVANVNIGGDNFIRRPNHYANILTTSDLDGDRIDELLLGASYFNRGIKISWARLVELEGGRLRVIKDFGVVDEDRCDVADEERITAGTIGYAGAVGINGGEGANGGGHRNDVWPSFSVAFFQSRCASVRDERRPEKFRPATRAEIASER